VYHYTVDSPLFKIQGRPNPYSTAISYLLGKEYTEYLQIGVAIEYGCGSDGFCEVKSIDPYGRGTAVRCTYGCLREPVEYRGKIYQNFCVCQEARVKNTELFCDYSRGNDVYYWSRIWTCEIDALVAMDCGFGGRCSIDPREGIGCWPIGSDAQTQSEATQYALTMPTGMNGPIYVVAMQNGRVIAKRPISNLSAEQYIAKYGPVRFDQAYAFAQKVGLTSLANSGSVSNRTPSTTFSTRKPATSTTFGSTGTLNSSYANVSGYRTISTYRNTYYNASNYSKSNYTPNSSYYRSTSYKPTTAYRSTYYRPSTTYTYKTYTKTYPTYSRYSYYNRYVSYKPYSTTSTYSSYSTGRYASYSRYNTARRISYSRYYYARRFS